MAAFISALVDFLSMRKNETVAQQVGSLLALLSMLAVLAGSAFTSIQAVRRAASDATAITSPYAAPANPATVAIVTAPAVPTSAIAEVVGPLVSPEVVGPAKATSAPIFGTSQEVGPASAVHGGPK